MNYKIFKADITTIEVDAIVNAANSSLMGGGGVDGAIHRKGGPKILQQCMEIRARQGGCKTGEAVVTTGGNLPSKFVIHTVAPVWNGGDHGEPQMLQSCYLKSLYLADEHLCESVAFPNISTGIYGYPKSEAASIALVAVKSLENKLVNVKTICFVCFDDENYAIYKNLLSI